MNRMYGKKSWYKILVGRCERKGTLEKTGCNGEDNIKMGFENSA
jgi:hypothetical protein